MSEHAMSWRSNEVWPAFEYEPNAFWQDVFECHVLCLLSAYDLWLMKLTCRGLKSMVEHYVYLHPAINLVVRPFFHNGVADFMRLLRNTGSYVSGSAALAFFTRNVCRDQLHDLDIYVTPFGMGPTVAFLRSHDYFFIPLSWQTLDVIYESPDTIEDDGNPERPYLGSNIVDVFNFENFEHEVVQVIVVDNSPMAAILDHHSTVVINYFTGFFAVSCYPYLTFRKHVNVPCNGTSTSDIAGRAKYVMRGWPLIDDEEDLRRESALKLSRIRFVGDSDSWVQRLKVKPMSNRWRPVAQSWAAYMPPSEPRLILHYTAFKRDLMTRYVCMDVAISRWAFCPMFNWTDTKMEKALRKLTDVDQDEIRQRRVARLVLKHEHNELCYHWCGVRRACTYLQKLLL